jgi:hypothetical protein
MLRRVRNRHTKSSGVGPCQFTYGQSADHVGDPRSPDGSSHLECEKSACRYRSTTFDFVHTTSAHAHRLRDRRRRLVRRRRVRVRTLWAGRLKCLAARSCGVLFNPMHCSEMQLSRADINPYIHTAKAPNIHDTSTGRTSGTLVGSKTEQWRISRCGSCWTVADQLILITVDSGLLNNSSSSSTSAVLSTNSTTTVQTRP